MQFRSSPILLVLCASALLGVVALWNLAPRLWGGMYRVASRGGDQKTEEKNTSTSTSEQFRIADAPPQSISIAPRTPVVVQNKLPRALDVTFTRESEPQSARDRMVLTIASSSSSMLSFATSGV